MAAVHYAVNWKVSTEFGEGDENSAVTPSHQCEQRFPVNGNPKHNAELKADLGASDGAQSSGRTRTISRLVSPRRHSCPPVCVCLIGFGCLAPLIRGGESPAALLHKGSAHTDGAHRRHLTMGNIFTKHVRLTLHIHSAPDLASHQLSLPLRSLLRSGRSNFSGVIVIPQRCPLSLIALPTCHQVKSKPCTGITSVWKELREYCYTSFETPCDSRTS